MLAFISVMSNILRWIYLIKGYNSKHTSRYRYRYDTLATPLMSRGLNEIKRSRSEPFPPFPGTPSTNPLIPRYYASSQPNIKLTIAWQYFSFLILQLQLVLLANGLSKWKNKNLTTLWKFMDIKTKYGYQLLETVPLGDVSFCFSYNLLVISTT